MTGHLLAALLCHKHTPMATYKRAGPINNVGQGRLARENERLTNFLRFNGKAREEMGMGIAEAVPLAESG